MTFKHELGIKVEARVTALRGIVIARSENLYGCNRYFIQPPAADNKVPDGWWVDEEDVVKLEDAIQKVPRETGGPMSKNC